jgi:myo-inositol-1(or 4)-monophosphatase
MMDIALKAAKSAGYILKEHFGKVPQGAIRQKTKNDFLSFVDEQSERVIIETIRSRFPEHAFLAEESGASNNHSPYLWIIDPLDGTKNYLSGIPVFAVSIALQHHNDLVLGIIYDPMRNELFHAETGKGAFLNNTPIQVSSKTKLSDCLLATGFPFKAKHLLPQYLNAFEAVFNRSIGMRRMGAAAVDLAYVAAGRFDAFWELGLSPWDVAAGAVLVTEAGGTVHDFWLGDRFLFNHYLLAANGNVQQELSGLLRQSFPTFKPVYPNKEHPA